MRIIRFGTLWKEQERLVFDGFEFEPEEGDDENFNIACIEAVIDRLWDEITELERIEFTTWKVEDTLR